MRLTGQFEMRFAGKKNANTQLVPERLLEGLQQERTKVN